MYQETHKNQQSIYQPIHPDASVGSKNTLLSPLRNAGSPVMTSSPKHTMKINNEFHKNRLNGNNNIHILNINLQTLRKKWNLLEALIESSRPDIVLGTDTRPDSSIKSSEIIPSYLNYDIERRDMSSDPRGGVLIAARSELLLNNITRNKNFELRTNKSDYNNRRRKDNERNSSLLYTTKISKWY